MNIVAVVMWIEINSLNLSFSVFVNTIATNAT